MSDNNEGLAHILVVDDDKMIARALTLGLEQEGYNVTSAHSSQEAIASAESEHPALVILDYSLPDEDGVSALRRLRQLPWAADLPVIIASNVYDVDIINAIMTLGVQDYVLKNDVKIEDIVALVGKYVPSPGATSVEVGD